MRTAHAQVRRRRQRQLHLPVHVRSTKPYRFDACLRIAGVGARHEEIGRVTGLVTARSHRKGDAIRKSKRSYSDDLWLLESPLGDDASLDEHVNWLWQAVEPHTALFVELGRQATWADVLRRLPVRELVSLDLPCCAVAGTRT